MIQTYYAYIDPVVQDLLVSNVPPDNTNQWWDLPGDVDVNALYIDQHGELSIRQAPPTSDPGWVWDITTETWTDPRDADALAASLQRARDQAGIDKAALLLALAQAGAISPGDAVIAAQGNIPPAFQSIIDGWPADMQLAAQIKWATDTTISRTNPLIMALAESIAMTPAELDALFGIVEATL